MRVTRLATVALVGFSAGQAAPAIPQAAAQPTLEIEKTRFAVGERIFFWVGAKRVGADPIPRAVWDTGRVVMTRPDGSTRVDTIGWPVDGMGVNGPGDLGWKGGWGLGSETPQVGTWMIVVEFAGQRTQPVSFTVEEVPIVKEIERAFVFSSPLVLDDPDATATLTVKNQSSESIRFVQRGQSGSNVSVLLTKTGGPAWSASFFVPVVVLTAATGSKPVPIMFDRFTWDAADSLPTVTLTAGQTYQLRLPLSAAIDGQGGGSSGGYYDGLEAIPAGTYDVQFSTELQLLIGARNGRWTDFLPLRLDVTSTAQGARRRMDIR